MRSLLAGLTQNQATGLAKVSWQPPPADLAHEKSHHLPQAGRVDDLQHSEVVSELSQAGDARDLAAEGAPDPVDAVRQELLQALLADGVATVQQFGPQVLLSEGLHADGALQDLSQRVRVEIRGGSHGAPRQLYPAQCLVLTSIPRCSDSVQEEKREM